MDNDGLVDVYFKTEADFPVQLYRNLDNRFFENVTLKSGLQFDGGVGDATWMDYNNDGWLDLHVVNFNFQGNDPAPDRLYLNNGDGTFQDITQEAAIDELHTGPHAVWGDYDRDGDMDLFLSHHHFDSQTNEFVSNFLFRNETVNNWLEINLETADNHPPVGTKVSVYTNQNILKREVTNGSIQAPQIADRLLFGLEQRSMVDSIVVLWRSGLRV